MSFPSSYDPAEAEPRWQAAWAAAQIYAFDPADPRPPFAIDTPPPTVSGAIHIGHVYSYTQAEAMARFWRMRGRNVYYPFGFDDNGLPTERFVERSRGIRARDVGRAAFIAACLETSAEVEDGFEAFWKRLGFGVDWRLRYSTIDPQARKIAQWAFIDLHRRGLIYRAQAPNPWCVACGTAVAQAEMEDVERATTFYTLAFGLRDERPTTNDQQALDAGAGVGRSSFVVGHLIPIATTRPELLPACVAVFVHPDDARYADLVGMHAVVPLIGRAVPILADPAVDPARGTGAVMCCTFGDTADVQWWRDHQLPLIPLLGPDGRLGAEGGPYAGLPLAEARARILADLGDRLGAPLPATPATQSVRVHERCGTPLEILETQQWFIRLLDAKEALLDAGRTIAWRPAHMRVRYEHWVQNLAWDWCISRQRFYGVPFPAWHCRSCGATVLADEADLPVDPLAAAPPRACACGSTDLRPDADVMDTWATSSLSPQIAGQMLADPGLYAQVFPMQLRPQAHDIIRTWCFYTIARSYLHFGQIPWETIMISGHALDPHGHKFSKSKGNAPTTPLALVERHGADALRYWSCGAALGADQPLSEEQMRQGRRLITKLWSVARLAEMQNAKCEMQNAPVLHFAFCIGDRALLSWLQALVADVTARWEAYDYAGALEQTERFFWATFCDNYLELVKGRLYDGDPAGKESARAALGLAFLTIVKLLAPVLPHICEEIYARLFATGGESIHRSGWPAADESLRDPQAERAGLALFAIAAAVRRHKTAQSRSLGSALAGLTIACDDERLAAALRESACDIRGVTRAAAIRWQDAPAGELQEAAPSLWVGIVD